MCGDTPVSLGTMADAVKVPPCVRGYALDVRNIQALGEGSPVCAGIRPLARHLADPPGGSPVCAGIRPGRTASKSPTKWFPRVCGDTPQPEGTPGGTSAVPPCVRGYAPVGCGLPPLPVGSPVCAGIRPGGRHRGGPGRWFPRVCGDTPCPASANSATSSVPPCVRGYARARNWERASKRGSPVCAGIRLSRARRSGRATRFPRVCGDTPRSRTRR